MALLPLMCLTWNVEFPNPSPFYSGFNAVTSPGSTLAVSDSSPFFFATLTASILKKVLEITASLHVMHHMPLFGHSTKSCMWLFLPFRTRKPTIARKGQSSVAFCVMAEENNILLFCVFCLAAHSAINGVSACLGLGTLALFTKIGKKEGWKISGPPVV